MSIASARRRYVTDAITTVSPAQLVVMLYERLLLDLTRAGDALQVNNLPGVHENLVHAQDIVLELEASLDVEVWSGAATLLELYRYLNRELVAANVEKDITKIAGCARLVAPLAEAWKTAAANPVDEVTALAPAPAPVRLPQGSGLGG